MNINNNNNIINIHIFNDLLDQLFEFLEESFTNYKSDIKLSKNTINMLRKSNYRLVIIQFKQYIEPYSQQINDCNEQFFIDLNNNNNLINSMKIKNIWLSKTTTKKQKAIIFYYFQQLLLTSSECYF